MSGRLVVCPTPIGNLEDVTLRVLAALREADVVACEDTRRTRVLLDRYGVKARLVSYHEHNEGRARPSSSSACARARPWRSCPTPACRSSPIPGYVLVRGCVAAGLAVEVLPGPSAAITALVASGLPADRWRFEGFLPRKKGELRRGARASRAARWWRSSRRGGCRPRWRCWPSSIPSAQVAVCRELTKVHEEVVRGSAGGAGGALRRSAAARARWCWWSAADRASGCGARAAPALDALRRLVEAGAKPRRAAAVVAELTGGSANALYRALTG